MRSTASLVLILALAGCAARQTEFSAAAAGPPADVIDCAAEEVGEAGFSVTDHGSAQLSAERGTDWVRVRVASAGDNVWRVVAESSDSDLASETAQEVVIECQDIVQP